MKIEKKEYASLGDGKLMKTICIILTPEDDWDKKIIQNNNDHIYLS